MKATDFLSLVEQDKPDFDQALKDFIFDSQGKIDAYFTRQYKEMEPHKLSIKDGPKYAHIISITQGYKDDPKGGQGSSWALVDKDTGDVFKPAGYGRPAKHARANVFDRESWKTVSPYGPAYLR